MLLIRDVRMFTGDAVLPRASVTVEDGLIDAHPHVFPGNLEQALVFGVTTVLDMMADPAGINELLRQARAVPTLADVRTAGTAAPCRTATDGTWWTWATCRRSRR